MCAMLKEVIDLGNSEKYVLEQTMRYSYHLGLYKVNVGNGNTDYNIVIVGSIACSSVLVFPSLFCTRFSIQ